VADTPVGKTTRPVKIDEGYTLIAVCATRQIDSDVAARSEIESKLMFEQADNIGKDYLKKLRDKAVIKYR
jgi:parvulin-like peptidyl-prolyl isomerase